MLVENAVFRKPEIQVTPIDRCSGYIRLCIGRVKTEELSKKMLKAMFKDSHADIDVIEDENYFILQYKTHAPLCISKSDGKFYSWNEKMEQEARIIWEILRKYGYIENPKRIKIRKKPYSYHVPPSSSETIEISSA